MKTEQIKSPILYREATLTLPTREEGKETSRTMDLSFSSEEPADQWFGREILSHDADAVDLTRLRGGGPVLVGHEREDVVGVVEKADIDGKRGKATIRFGKSSRAQEIFTDVMDGIRKSVSVGYRIRKMEKVGEAEGVETFRVTKWTPLEISIVSIPADPTVGIGRSTNNEEPIEVLRKDVMAEPNKDTTPTPTPQAQPQVDVSVVREDGIKAERERIKEIRAIGERMEKHNPQVVRDLTNKATEGGMSLNEYRDKLFSSIGPEPVAVRTEDPSIGMSKKDLKQYSITNAIRSCVNRRAGSPDGFEGEVSQEVAKRTGRNPSGFFIPWDVQSQRSVGLTERVLQVGTFTGAGALVQTTDGGQSMIELLRNNMVVMQAGATSLSGLVGDVNIPRQSGGGTANWLAEDAALTRADQTVGQLALRPHRLAASTAYSKQLLNQSSTDVEGFVRSDLMAVIAIAKDLACLRGTGASGQPLGIVNTTGLSTAATHTSGGTFTWGQAIDYESHVEDSNALMGRCAYVMRPADKAVAKATVRDSGGGGFVWDNNQINGYPAFSTNQLTSGAGGTLFGNFSDLIVADWDGMDVVVDPYTLSLSNQVSIVITTLTDIGIRHPASFAISTA